MKLNRGTANAATAIVTISILLILAGCGGGGQKTHDVSSPYRGDLYGVETQPRDREVGIAVDSWIEVYWPHSQYPPPATFTVSVEKEESPNEWGGIHTIQKDDSSDPDNGVWWFEPAGDFSPDTCYRITVKDDAGRQSMSYFRTIATTRSAISTFSAPSPDAAAKTYKPANATSSTAAGELEHVIKTGKS